MDDRPLSIDQQGRLLACRLHDPREQTLNTPMLHELHHLLGTTENDEELRVFMVTGTDGP